MREPLSVLNGSIPGFPGAIHISIALRSDPFFNKLLERDMPEEESLRCFLPWYCPPE